MDPRFFALDAGDEGARHDGRSQGAKVRQSYKTFFLWAVLILLFFSFYSIFSRQRTAEPKEIDASEFYAAVDKGEVSSVNVKGNTLQGQYKNRQEFRTVSPLDQN